MVIVNFIFLVNLNSFWERFLLCKNYFGFEFKIRKIFDFFESCIIGIYIDLYEDIIVELLL